MPKEILYLSYHFPPYSNILSNRATEFSKRLIESDYKIFVVSAKNNKNATIDKELLKTVDSPLIKNAQVYNLSFSSSGVASSVKKISILKEIFNIFLFFHWLPLSFAKSSRIIRKNHIRLIYTSAPPFFSLVLGYLLKKIFKIPLITEYRDPWSDNPYFLGNISEFTKRNYNKIDKKVLKTSDAIIAISEGLKEYLIKAFPSIVKEDKVFAIPNGLDMSSFLATNVNIPQSNKIVLTFTGKLYGLRDLKPLIKIISSVKELGKLEGVSLKINIFGRYNYENLSNLIQKYKVSEYFSLNGFIPRNECLEEISESTLTLHVGENINYPTISFKVWDYLSMRKKIVYLGREDSFTARFLKDNNLGFTIPVNNHDLGVKKFISLIDRLISNQIKLEVDPKQLSKYTWDNLTPKLISIFNKF
ncbi:MAG: glycosyltransferase [Candidatus Lokiarchaeota archaeon]|nr:glycosyltransferase [Candidatus Lokiarchaeota archaeon]